MDEIRPEDGLVILHKGQVLASGRTDEVTKGDDLTRTFLRLTGEDA
jgi:ABC-2 type transport system ATP-binding protein